MTFDNKFRTLLKIFLLIFCDCIQLLFIYRYVNKKENLSNNYLSATFNTLHYFIFSILKAVYLKI